MKQHFIFFLLMSAFTHALAQELPYDEVLKKVVYTSVVNADGQTQKSLYDKAKKWIATKKTEATPYSVVYDDEKSGSVNGKGTFMMPAGRNKYTVQFAINIQTKQGKIKYEITDIVIQFRTKAGSSGGGFGYWGGSTYHEAENLEYSLETFYPSRLESRKPSIKWYEDIGKKSFAMIDEEIKSLVGSLKQNIASKEDW